MMRASSQVEVINTMNDEMKYVRWVIAGLLAIALFDLPYGYYTFLRLIVCLSAAYFSYIGFANEQGFTKYIWLGVAILFNPLIPIYLDRSMWAVLDIVTAVLYLTIANPGKPKSEDE